MEPTHEDIATRAYYLWEKHGWNLKAAGYSLQAMRDWCWFQAESELASSNELTSQAGSNRVS